MVLAVKTPVATSMMYLIPEPTSCDALTKRVFGPGPAAAAAADGVWRKEMLNRLQEEGCSSSSPPSSLDQGNLAGLATSRGGTLETAE